MGSEQDRKSESYPPRIRKEGYMSGKEPSDIYCWEIESDKLKIYLASTEKGALRVGISLKKAPDCVTYFQKIYPSKRIVKNEHRNRSLVESVKAALSNRPDRNKLPLYIRGTPFQMKVWKALKRIPFGETRTYGEVASMVRNPKSARAIGQAMGKNPLPLIFA
jgi:O6-methylguanine-DNA--protein-cysteine methyltransferase